MSEATKDYKYESNKNVNDATELVGVPGGELVRQGGVLSLTEQEYDQLKGRINLSEVSSAKESATQDSGTKPEFDK